jgi:hypothetical protein
VETPGRGNYWITRDQEMGRPSAFLAGTSPLTAIFCGRKTPGRPSEAGLNPNRRPALGNAPTVNPLDLLCNIVIVKGSSLLNVFMSHVIKCLANSHTVCRVLLSSAKTT